MTDAHEAGKVGDARSFIEDFAGHAVALALVYAAARSARGDTAGILASVLQKVEGIVYFDSSGGFGVGVNDSNDAAHDCGP